MLGVRGGGDTIPFTPFSPSVRHAYSPNAEPGKINHAEDGGHCKFLLITETTSPDNWFEEKCLGVRSVRIFRNIKSNNYNLLRSIPGACKPVSYRDWEDPG